MAKLIQIKTLKELSQAALDRRVVVVPKDEGFKKPTPAAYVISMQGRYILGLFNKGMFIYKKKSKRSYYA